MATVTTRNLNWQEIVIKSWGKDWTEPEVAFEFTGRKFNDRRPPRPATPPVVVTTPRGLNFNAASNSQYLGLRSVGGM